MMINERASENDEGHVVDIKQKIDMIECAGKTGTSPREVKLEIRWVKDEQERKAAPLPDPEQKPLPSEVFIG